MVEYNTDNSGQSPAGASGTSTSDTNLGFLRAARAGNKEKVLEGIESGVDINCSNSNGLGALHLASKEGYVELVTTLIELGSRVDSPTKKGYTPLHIASLGGKVEVVTILIKHGSPINAQTLLGFTPLYMAAQENKEEVVRYLLEHGADPSLPTEEGYTPLAVALQQGSDKAVGVLLEYGQGSKIKLPALHIAAKKDDVGAAKLLLKSESADKESMSGFTPLHIAAHYGKTNVAKLLIDMGADVNYKAKNAIAPFHVAAKWGQLGMMQLLLQRDANVNAQTKDGLTPLHCAARSGYVRVVDFLLENNADHSSKTRNGLTPLHMAAQGDHVDCARLIIHSKANVNEVTVDYLTALHVAAHYGHVKTAKLLLDRNCDVNARALNGFTPLHIACKKNRIKVVELLLKYGASIEATTESGLTPLHVAAFMGNMNIVLNLLNNGAGVDTRTMRGETPLHLAARANQTDVMRILLRNKADVNARAREQQTPLHIAARMGNVDNVLLLLQHGADPDAVTKDGYSPLHIAAKEGHEEVIGVLIDQSAEPNSVTKKGMTPLHIAAKYGQTSVARLLLQRGAQADKQGRNGLTALHVAAHYNKPSIVVLLLEDFRASPHMQAKNGYTPLHIAAKKNQMDIATSLLEFGARAVAESRNGFTPLHLAAQEGHTDMVSLLLESKADANCQAVNGLTALHLCAQEDHVHVAEILCKYECTIDPRTKAGYTPLHTASHFGQINMVRFLLERQAEVNAATRLGYTPLHQAAQQGHVLVVNILLKAGASPNAKTHNGVTALQIARRLGYVSVETVLQSITEEDPEQAHLSGDYSMAMPEKMEEHSISDSEEEHENDEVFPYQYPFLGSDSYMGQMRGGSTNSYRPSEKPAEQDAAVETHQDFDESDIYAEESFEEQLSPLSMGSVRQYQPRAAKTPTDSPRLTPTPSQRSQRKRKTETELDSPVAPSRSYPNMAGIDRIEHTIVEQTYMEKTTYERISASDAGLPASGSPHTYQESRFQPSPSQRPPQPYTQSSSSLKRDEHPQPGARKASQPRSTSSLPREPAKRSSTSFQGRQPQYQPRSSSSSLSHEAPTPSKRGYAPPDSEDYTNGQGQESTLGQYRPEEPMDVQYQLPTEAGQSPGSQRSPRTVNVQPAPRQIGRKAQREASRRGPAQNLAEAQAKEEPTVEPMRAHPIAALRQSRPSVNEAMDQSVAERPESQPVYMDQSEHSVELQSAASLSYATPQAAPRTAKGSASEEDQALALKGGNKIEPLGNYTPGPDGRYYPIDEYGQPIVEPDQIPATMEDQAAEGYIPVTPSYLPTHSPRQTKDNISEGYEEEPWKTQPHDDSEPPPNDDPKGGVFIPPKGHDATMYDIYKTEEQIKAERARDQLAAAADTASIDVEPGYSLTPTGQIIGPDGKVLLGPNREPIELSPDANSKYSLAPDGTILGPDRKPLVDKDGTLVRVKPSGSKIILEPSGKLTHDDKGKPLVVEAGTQLVKPGRDGKVKVGDTVVLDCDTGKPIHLRQANADKLLVVGPNMKTVNIGTRPIMVDDGSVLITPGLQNYVVFANGRPVIGEDNEPVCVPSGSHLKYPNMDGTVNNSTGKLVTDVESVPLRVVDRFASAVILTSTGYLAESPKGTIVRVPVSSTFAMPNSDGVLIGPDRKKVLGPDGKAVKVPDGHAVVVNEYGKPVLGADCKSIFVPLNSTMVTPFADGRVVNAEGAEVLDKQGKPVIINPEASCYIITPSKTIVTDRDGHFVRVPLGSVLVTPGKDGKIKGPDGKKVHAADGKTAKVDTGARDPVVLQPGARLLESKTFKPVQVPVDSVIAYPDECGRLISDTGVPVTDVTGRQIQILPDRSKFILGPEDYPICDRDGRVIAVPGGSRLTIPGQQEAILGPNGMTVSDENGVPLGVDQGTTLMTVHQDHFVYLPDGTKMTTPEGRVFKYTPDETVAVGPDYHPITDKAGKPIPVPRGSVVVSPRQKYVIDNDGHPVADKRGRSIAADKDTIILQVDGTGKALLPSGEVLCDAAGRPIEATPHQEILVEATSMKPLLDSRGQPVITIQGVNLAQPGQLLYIVCPDKTVVEDDNAQPVWVAPGTKLCEPDADGYTNAGDGKLLGSNKFPLKIPAGQLAVVGPDQKPVTYTNGSPVFVPEGSVIAPPGDDLVRNLDGVPVLDTEGRAIAVEPGTRVTESQDDGTVLNQNGQPVIDRDGKPLIVAPRSLLLITPSGKPVQNKSGRPVPVPRGSKITPVQHDNVVDSAGDPILDTMGFPLQVTPGTRVLIADEDGCMYLPDGEKVTDPLGAPLTFIPGRAALVGPDGKVITNDQGEPVQVPADSTVHKRSSPPMQKVQRPEIIEDIVAQEQALTAKSSAPQQSELSNGSLPRKAAPRRGVFAEPAGGTPTSPPPLPTTLPPGSLPWSLFTLRRKEKTIEDSYSGPTFGAEFNPDNVQVDKSPIFTGFLVSFMVDARGGAMRGCRHAGVRIVIPPGMATGPTRVTCRMTKKEKMSQHPPLNDGEGLAARVVSLGPVGTQFLGPVIIEIPHFASLRGGEREVVVMRSDDGKKWAEHTMQPTDDLVFNAVNSSFDGDLYPEGDIEPLEDLAAKRITRIVTTKFPKYFALVSRVKVATQTIGPQGGIVSSTVIPQAQVVFPPDALVKPIKVGLQAQPVPTDLVAKLYGNRAAVSPIITLEPRRRRFHKQLQLAFPLPRAATKGMTNQYDQRTAGTLRLLCSFSDTSKPTEWQDITDQKELSFVNNCVSFATDISASYWLVDYQQTSEVTSMANTLYKELCSVPFMSRFVVFGKRHTEREARLRVFCMTDDKMDKTLETQQYFSEVARSRDIEVTENKEQWLEMAGNLVPITRTNDTQLHIKFKAFAENRLPFVVRIRDQEQDPSGRVAFMRDPRVSKGDTPQQPICNLQINLPEHTEEHRTASDFDLSKTADFNERYRAYRDYGVSVISENIVSTNLKLSEIAAELGSDWTRLAPKLSMSNRDVDRLQNENPDPEQASLKMLQLWVKHNGTAANGNALARALDDIDRHDVVENCIDTIIPVTDAAEKEEAKQLLGIDKEKEDEVRLEKDGEDIKIHVPHEVGEIETPVSHETKEIEVPVSHETRETELPVSDDDGEVEISVSHLSQDKEVEIPISYDDEEVEIPVSHEDKEVEIPVSYEDKEVEIPFSYDDKEVEIPVSHEDKEDSISSPDNTMSEEDSTCIEELAEAHSEDRADEGSDVVPQSPPSGRRDIKFSRDASLDVQLDEDDLLMNLEGLSKDEKHLEDHARSRKESEHSRPDSIPEVEEEETIPDASHKTSQPPSPEEAQAASERKTAAYLDFIAELEASTPGSIEVEDERKEAGEAVDESVDSSHHLRAGLDEKADLVVKVEQLESQSAPSMYESEPAPLTPPPEATSDEDLYLGQGQAGGEEESSRPTEDRPDPSDDRTPAGDSWISEPTTDDKLPLEHQRDSDDDHAKALSDSELEVPTSHAAELSPHEDEFSAEADEQYLHEEADYSSDDMDAKQSSRALDTIEEMPSTIPQRYEPPIDGTYESGLDLISSSVSEMDSHSQPLPSPTYERSQSDQDLSRDASSSQDKLDRTRHHSSPEHFISDSGETRHVDADLTDEGSTR